MGLFGGLSSWDLLISAGLFAYSHHQVRLLCKHLLGLRRVLVAWFWQSTWARFHIGWRCLVKKNLDNRGRVSIWHETKNPNKMLAIFSLQCCMYLPLLVGLYILLYSLGDLAILLESLLVASRTGYRTYRFLLWNKQNFSRTRRVFSKKPL